MRINSKHLNNDNFNDILFYFRKMQNPQCTIICFDYGGYYMKDGVEINRSREMVKEKMKFT